MGLDRLELALNRDLQAVQRNKTAKWPESIITRVKPPEGSKGPRYFLQGRGDQEFIRMNSNSYLGMSMHMEVIRAEETAVQEYGCGPGAVRFISGSLQLHRDLEQRLACFHDRDDAVLFSSAYMAMLGVLPPLVTERTIVLSDELNHNCIINAIRLCRPLAKKIYRHLDMADLETKIQEAIGVASRAIIVTDGIFSMRGDCAPLDRIGELSEKYDAQFAENIVTVVDDSHGIGAFGDSGRGTEEYTGASGVDVLLGTLGKAFGVNGGYIVSSDTLVRYLRETAPTYIYSNPITPAEAAAAGRVLEIVDSAAGTLIAHLRGLTHRLEQGFLDLGYETIQSAHPIVPLLVRDTQRTSELVNYLDQQGVLATGLNYPVVPKGDETIRFQTNADQTTEDIDSVLEILDGTPIQ